MNGQYSDAARVTGCPQGSLHGVIRRDARRERDQRLLARKLGVLELPVDADVAQAKILKRSEQPRPLPPLIEVADSAPWCLVVPNAEGGQLSEHDKDTLAAGRLLADQLEGGVVVCVPDTSIDWTLLGADRVIRCAVQESLDDMYMLALIKALVERDQPAHVVFPESQTRGGHLARLLSVQLEKPVASEVKRVERGQVMRSLDAGKLDQWLQTPMILTVQPEVAELGRGTRREAREWPCPLVSFEPVAEQISAPQPPDSLNTPLAEVDFIVSGGSGVTDWEGLTQVAIRLGAGLGATRAVCDAGLVPRDRQVGISGTLVSPRCYLSFGISGASQHLQGLIHCERVVAVNTDLHAEMIKRSDLALVVDAQPVIRELLQLLDSDDANATPAC